MSTAEVIEVTARATHAEGVRTGRRQALEEAAALAREAAKVQTSSFMCCGLALLDMADSFATRGDEAHTERTQP